ncbi:hypothetical protein ABZZ17_24605 [Streptomyces sp. NPDC006512]|uniref:hypothetical protein n=1 Tax=Streptomyces sp. NPDC006512 TaxID=3154307 RepID=UPI0033BBCC2C
MTRNGRDSGAVAGVGASSAGPVGLAESAGRGGCGPPPRGARPLAVVLCAAASAVLVPAVWDAVGRDGPAALAVVLVAGAWTGRRALHAAARTAARRAAVPGPAEQVGPSGDLRHGVGTGHDSPAPLRGWMSGYG